MNIVNIDKIKGEGKENQFVIYNSAFRKIRNAQLIDISNAMESLVIPNDYKGLVIGIGYPEPPEYFPKKMDLERLSKEDSEDFKSLKSRVMKSDDYKNFFERMIILEKALYKDIPSDSKKKKKLRELGVEDIPIERVFIIPKPPHIAYPHQYDLVCEKDFQGYFEPQKKQIQGQYINIGSYRESLRLKQKDADKRNIPVIVNKERNIGERNLLLLNKNEENQLLKNLKDQEFELNITSFFNIVENISENDILYSDIMSINDTIINAEKNSRESVIVIPYKPVPKDIKENWIFWNDMRSSRQNKPTMPFYRYSIVKENIDSMFTEDEKNRKKIHITFMEIDENGNIPHQKKSLSYLPDNLAAIHGPEKLVSGLNNSRKTKTSVFFEDPKFFKRKGIYRSENFFSKIKDGIEKYL